MRTLWGEMAWQLGDEDTDGRGPIPTAPVGELIAIAAERHARVQSAVENPKAPDLWSEFALAVFAVNGLIIRAGETISRPLGQSSARWQVLGRVYRPRTVPDIARDIGLARQSVQRTADLLAAEGLVRFRPYPSDRRTQLVELTPEGLEVLSQIYQRQLQWSSRILERLDLDMLRDLSSALTDIAAVLRRDLEIDRGDRQQQKEKST